MAETQSNKRRRAHSGSQDRVLDKTSVIFDKEAIIPEGNIFLVAQNVAFRVHKSGLSRVSEIFHDLFDFPQDNNNDTLHGLPYVRVLDDPEDVRRLLLVVCRGKNYYYESDELTPVPFRVLASLIRMGHKYAIQSVLNDALSRLKKYYTSDLSAWIDVQVRERFVSEVDQFDAITVIQLARLTNTPILLPTAMFIACQLAETIHHSGNRLVISDLSAHDVALLIAAKVSLANTVTAHLISLSYCLPSAQCRRRQSCIQATQDALRMRSYAVFMNEIGEEKALDLLYDWFWDLPPVAGAPPRSICADCTVVSRQFDAEVRAEVWSSLPRHFNMTVDGWPANADLI